jgi:hypothetical protein
MTRALPHRRASIDFFCALVSSEARRHLAPVRVEGRTLHRARLGERSCRLLVGTAGNRPYGVKAALAPDGLAMLEVGDRWAPLFLELDRGIEDGRRLEDKLARYAWMPPEAVVLFCFTEAARARSWRPGSRAVRLLIGNLDRHRRDPWGSVWLDSATQRWLSLAEGARL